MKGIIIYFSLNGKEVANKIKNYNTNFIVFEEGQQKEFVEEHFFSSQVIVFVGAIGIAIRYISNLIKTKDKDPAVIVIDEKMQFVIPILSGHLGGANEFAIKIANVFNSTPVITTSTDIHGVFAIDVWAKKNNCKILNIDAIKIISSSLLNKETVMLCSDFKVVSKLPNGLVIKSTAEKGINISIYNNKKPFSKTLKLVPKILAIGAGCRKGVSLDVFESVVIDLLQKENIDINSISKLATIDVKKNERCFVQFAEKYDIELVTYSADILKSAKGNFASSNFVLKTVNVDNVCERSAWTANKGQFVVRKTKCQGVTIAITKKEWSVDFENYDGID